MLFATNSWGGDVADATITKLAINKGLGDILFVAVDKSKIVRLLALRMVELGHMYPRFLRTKIRKYTQCSWRHERVRPKCSWSAQEHAIYSERLNRCKQLLSELFLPNAQSRVERPWKDEARFSGGVMQQSGMSKVILGLVMQAGRGGACIHDQWRFVFHLAAWRGSDQDCVNWRDRVTAGCADPEGDCSAVPNSWFDDLANLIRLARIDHGIGIR